MKHGYIHIRDVISPGFTQYLFEFPSDDTAFEFRDQIAALTGCDPEKSTVSERHLKQYDEHARAFPAPHKDRGAFRISVGIPIHLGTNTSVCLFPALDRSNNDGESAIHLGDKDGANLMSLYQDAKAVFLHESVGDLIVSEGSSLFHERTQPAGAAIVYIKLNDLGLGPLGENIYGARPEDDTDTVAGPVLNGREGSIPPAA